MFNLGFYSHDLPIGSATNDLVHQVRVSLDCWKGMFEVFIYSLNMNERQGRGEAKVRQDLLAIQNTHKILYFEVEIFS